MSLGFDPIGLIERGYGAASDTSAWVRGMAAPIFAAFNPSADYAYAFCLEPQGPSRVFWLRTGGFEEHALTAELALMHARYTPGMLRALLDSVRAPGLLTALEITGSVPQSEVVRVSSGVDSPVVVVHASDQPPIVFATLSRDPYRIDGSMRALWRKVAIHLSAGCRLSGRVASTDAPDVECVMTPGGRVVHADGPAESRCAREQLRAAVKNIDRARVRRGRSDPHAALELWRGMFFGRWSLVDHFDSDGRRYVLARLNMPGASGSSALPLRQRQALFFASAGWSNKEIGYALGIAETTVASHLKRALASTGVASRAAWIRLSSELACAG